jgi:hypothetical protein
MTNHDIRLDNWRMYNSTCAREAIYTIDSLNASTSSLGAAIEMVAYLCDIS